MRSAILLTGCVLLAGPAVAWQTPKRVSGDSPVCTVPYNANEGVVVSAVLGDTVTIELGDTRAIKEVAVSDNAHLKKSVTGNVLWLKPTDTMTPQPISVRAVRDDGKSEIYILQWTAEKAAEPPCDLVRFLYPQDAVDQRAAEAAKRRAEYASAAASRTLHRALALPTAGSVVNKNYAIAGNASLIPTQLAPAAPVVLTPQQAVSPPTAPVSVAQWPTPPVSSFTGTHQ
jgi:type IV secretory pathway VirB9-like protein